MKIIDCHCHIYPEKIASKAVQSIGDFYDIPMSFDGRLDTMLKVGKNANIEKFMVFSVATTPKQVTSINRFIKEQCLLHSDTLCGLGTLHPDSADIKGDILQIVDLGLHGVKLHPDFQRFKLDDKKCFPIYEYCTQYNLPLLIHAGDSRYDFSNPNRIKAVLENFHELKLIGAHFGGYTLWETAAKELHGYKNFWVDCSSSFMYLKKETASKLISMYTPDRVLFGSDFPMWNPIDNIEYIESLDISLEDKEKIFRKNAEKLFKLT